MASYIDRALVDGESVLARAYYHWLSWVVPVLAVSVPVVLQILSWAVVASETRARLDYVTYALIVLGLVYFLWEYIRIKTTEVAVTDRRFIRKTGWIGRDASEIELRSVEETALKQTILGRLMGYGTLTVRGTGAGLIVSPGIDDPKKFQKAIQTAQERMRIRLGAQGVTPAAVPKG